MEMMPFHTADEPAGRYSERESLPTWGPLAHTDWRAALPVVGKPQLTLRDLRIEDAPALLAQLSTEEVARFISPPPSSVAGFERFIRWAHGERAAGQYACFVVVPAGQTTPVGLFQIRVLDADRARAEWGFALGSAYWGTGLFLAAAGPVVDFAFGQMGMQRLEARTVLANGRGNGALRKVGAVREALLPHSFEKNGERLDQALWTIAREDWWAVTTSWVGTVH